MKDLLAYAPALVLWLAVVYKLPPFLRSPRDPGRRCLWLSLAFLALAVTILVPPVYVGVDAAIGIPNFSRLFSNSMTLASCWTVQVFLAHLSGTSDRRVIRWNGLALVAALTLMTVLFLTALRPREALNFPEGYGTTPQILAYRLVYLVYVALTQATIVRLVWSYARVASHPSLRLGLRLVASGAVAGLLYVAQDATSMALQRLNLPFPLVDPVTLHQTLVALAVVPGAVGATMPSWGPRAGIPRLARWSNGYRSLRRLSPLWRTLVDASPEIALMPLPSLAADVVNLRDIDFRLYRRVVEIRDGILALQPYTDPAIVADVQQWCHEANLPADETNATVDAAVITAGRQAKLLRQVSQEDFASIDAPRGGGNDLDREVLYLERVAQCYARSPIIRRMRASLAACRNGEGDKIWMSEKGHRDEATRRVL